MNIFGEGFSKEIIDQIRYRQEIYGSGWYKDRTNTEIVYLNGNTSWCKLVSGVDIISSDSLNNPTIKSLNLTTNELAKKFVLFNGTAAEGGKLRAGINPENNILGGDYAYGIGGTEFGIRPMMGIQEASIKHENRGSLRRAVVKLKAFNRAQFEIIDVLYLRLGFTVLLEWGHSMVIDNDGEIDTNPISLSLANRFLEGGDTYSYFLELIYAQRLAAGGNYDAMLAKVANFSWSLLPDGTYDITVYLSSIGDVIESLKTNILTDSIAINGTNAAATAQADSTNSSDIIDNFAYHSNIGNFLYVCKTLINDASLGKTDGDYRTLTLNDPTITAKINSDPSFLKFDTSIFDSGADDVLSVANNAGSSLLSFLPFFGSSATNRRYYIRLGTFLQFMEDCIIPFVYNKDKTRINSILDFDTEEETNIITLLPTQVGVDPRICFVIKDMTIPGNTPPILKFGPSNANNPILNIPLNTSITPSTRKTFDYCNVMNVYLEMSFILNKIIDLKDDKGNLLLIDFLKSLTEGMNEGLGGVNDFDIFIDEASNLVRIIDKNPLPFLDKVIDVINTNYPNSPYNHNRNLNTIPKTPIFNLFGYNLNNFTSSAGFIRDFSLTSQITPDLASIITIAASAQGSVVGENDTALSKLNKGLSDRYKPAIDVGVTVKSNDNATRVNEIQAEFNRIYIPYVDFLGKLSKNIADDSSIETFKTNYPSIIQKKIELEKAKDIVNNTKTAETYQGTGFLPFNMGMTLDGLSGIKINQQFTMNTDFLPSNYPESMLFLIRNLSHEIKNNKWVTKIETYAIGKLDPNASGSTTDFSVAGGSGGSSSGGGGSFVPASVPIVPGSALRQAIVRQAYAYYNKNILAIDSITKFTSNGVVDPAFKADLKSVNFQDGQLWCQYFTNLVWKKAYEEVGASDPNIANIAATKLNNFRGYKPLNGSCPKSLNNMKDLGAAEDFQLGITKLYPGDMVLLDNHIRGRVNHVQIVVEADNTARTLKTIGGNESNKVRISPSRSMDNTVISPRTYGQIIGVIRPIE